MSTNTTALERDCEDYFMCGLWVSAQNPENWGKVSSAPPDESDGVGASVARYGRIETTMRRLAPEVFSTLQIAFSPSPASRPGSSSRKHTHKTDLAAHQAGRLEAAFCGIDTRFSGASEDMRRTGVRRLQLLPYTPTGMREWERLLTEDLEAKPSHVYAIFAANAAEASWNVRLRKVEAEADEMLEDALLDYGEARRVVLQELKTERDARFRMLLKGDAA